MSGNYASTSRAAEKEVEGTPMERAVNLLLVAAKKLDCDNNNKQKEAHNVGGSRIDFKDQKDQSDKETKKCADVLVDNSNPKPGPSQNGNRNKEQEPTVEAMKLLGSGQTPIKMSAKKLDYDNNNKQKEAHNVGGSRIDFKDQKDQSDKETKKCADVLVDNSNPKPGPSQNGNRNKEQEPTVEAMKLLGSGQTPIKMSAYKKIKWESYTKATRQLLVELIPRTVLASHSLSGKQSPAFQHKAAKQCLDATIISDITETVCGKCQVKENLVRHIITIKCADEAKMLRQREKMAKRRTENNSRPRVEPEEEQNELPPQENLRNKLRSVYLSAVREKHK